VYGVDVVFRFDYYIVIFSMENKRGEYRGKSGDKKMKICILDSREVLEKVLGG